MNTTPSQPKALYLLFSVRMWECFSFYGMRALLILYMIEALQFSESYAFGVYALYCALVEIGGVIGGTLADKYLGLRKAIFTGGVLIALGHLCLSLGDQNGAFFWSLALIIIGSSLFSGNITALLGQFYHQEDPRREAGFTLFYMGINIGALLATLLCGAVGEIYGWHYGFGLAAIGMLIGNIAFLSLHSLLEHKGKGPTIWLGKKVILSAVYFSIGIPLCVFLLKNESLFLAVLPCVASVAVLSIFYRLWKVVPRSQLATLGFYMVIFALFFAAEEQIGSSLMVFSDKYGSKRLLGIPIPSSVLLSANPFVIIVGGFVLNYCSPQGSSRRLPLRIALACAIGGAAFLLLSASCLWIAPTEVIPSAILVVVFGMISLAELLLAPAIIAYCSAIIPDKYKGMGMGLIPLGFSFASLLGGFFSKGMTDQFQSYQQGYLQIGLILFTLSTLPLVQLIYKYKKVQS